LKNKNNILSNFTENISVQRCTRSILNNPLLI